ncbi:MAG TPA: hypothetical protein VGX03_39455 [Candidatus Binatia bacterium]|jgi:hypothetical protein|nr:hypothetical protein [Candidatus Binatia bacterium]
MHERDHDSDLDVDNSDRGSSEVDAADRDHAHDWSLSEGRYDREFEQMRAEFRDWSAREGFDRATGSLDFSTTDARATLKNDLHYRLLSADQQLTDFSVTDFLTDLNHGVQFSIPIAWPFLKPVKVRVWQQPQGTFNVSSPRLQLYYEVWKATQPAQEAGDWVESYLEKASPSVWETVWEVLKGVAEATPVNNDFTQETLDRTGLLIEPVRGSPEYDNPPGLRDARYHWPFGPRIRSLP